MTIRLFKWRVDTTGKVFFIYDKYKKTYMSIELDVHNGTWQRAPLIWDSLGVEIDHDISPISSTVYRKLIRRIFKWSGYW